MKNDRRLKLIMAIGILVIGLVMFILNYAAPNFPGWLAVFAGGIAIVICTMIAKDKEE